MIAQYFIGLSSLILLFSLCNSSFGQAVDPALPSAEDVIDQHILATGGYEYLASMSSMHTVWTKTEGVNEWKFERWSVPGQKYSERSLNGQIQQTDGCWVAESSKENAILSGVAWRQRGENDLHIQANAELHESLLATVTVDETTHWFDRCESVRCVAKTKIDGKACYQLKFVGRDGEESDRFFDVESWYLVCKVSVEHQTGGSVVTRNYSNHKKIGDVVVATKQTIISNNRRDVWEIQSFEHDAEIDIELFDVPERVRIAIIELHASLELAKESAVSR